MTQLTRIAIISEHASPLAAACGVDSGGQNIYVNHVARKLAGRGHQVEVFTRRDSADLAPVVDLCRGARLVHVPAGPPHLVRKEDLLPCMPAFAQGSEMRLRGQKPFDVVHANFFMSGLVARHLQRTLKLPFAMTFHALGLVRLRHQKEADAFPPARIAIERQCVRDADVLIAECPQNQEDLQDLYDAAPEPIAMVPCGFDAAEFSPCGRVTARRALGIAQDEFLVLQQGRLVPRNGIDNVIEALARARAMLGPGARLRLLVVGGDAPEPDERKTPEIARVRHICEGLGVAADVHFTGYRQSAQLRYYAAFDITPLEAMACAVPVLASDVGGLRYSAVDGTTGFLVPARDPQALPERLALASRLGRAGRRRVQAMFTWDKVVDGLLAAYRGVVRQPAPPYRVPEHVSPAVRSCVAMAGCL